MAAPGSVISERLTKIESAAFGIPVMSKRDKSRPRLRAGFHSWSFQDDRCHVLFLGKGPDRHRQKAFDSVVDKSGVRHSWPRQIHSTRVVEVQGPGLCGDADALTTGRVDLALSVATADCLPIVVAGPRRVATIHAGWRGLAGRIIQATLDDFDESPEALQAWIGPGIGACCYEVGADVAGQVAAVSHPSVAIPAQPRPLLDLVAAAEWQLTHGGVQRIHSLSICTRCSPEWLWSYRRDKDDAGRNWAFAWRR